MMKTFIAILILAASCFGQNSINNPSSSSTSLPFTPLIQYAMTDCTANVSCPDTSGNGNTGTLTNGTVTSKGLNFGGNSVVQISTSKWASVRTILMWYRSAPLATETTNFFQTLFAGDFGAPMEIRYPSGNTALYTASNQTVAASRGLLGDSFLGIVFGATPKIFYGPNEETAYIAQQSFTPSGTPAFFSLGQTGGSFPFRNQMYYFLAFTQTLTATQVAQALNFVNPILAARGVKINSGPVDPQILYVGDSITDCAVASTQPCHTFYNAKFLGMTHTNLGVVAQTQAAYTYTTTVIPLITQGNTVVVNYLGTNDIAGNATAATTFAALQTNCTAVHAVGGLCIPVTTLPRDVTFTGGQTAGGFETQRLLLATSISGDTTDFDGYADPANDPIIGTGGATTADNTSYYIDKVHPTTLGNRFLASYITNAIYGALKRGPACNVYTFSVSGGNWNVGINGSGTIPAAAVAAATTQSVPFFWIQPRSKVASVSLKTTTVWAGTGFTSLGVTVGDSLGGATFYTTPSYNLLTAVGATNYADSGSLEKSGGSLGSNLTLQFTANQNLNANALTGAIDVTVCMDTRP